MPGVFPFPFPLARRFRILASTRPFSLGPFRWHVRPFGASRQLRSSISGGSARHSPAGVAGASFGGPEVPL